ncbi:hypothetical protein MNEG_1981 [Monoraphidium neglectum]|uniref:Uncharacterized protein n=1 Tax=Monoraphidium neglectum TaxID=145388 RepID=A0A0D2K6L7_9CHLO|nr:hypothetical protein MNEG_1981 [Monoraphidium neglectum]KIZ05973.1 hypothetical protein MNEG_1981 [Monoraphidium neglectum]|eukprot:XP_013904992.1 hypothetical protein MNEG_1981 [Monoraphidium neglectum]
MCHLCWAVLLAAALLNTANATGQGARGLLADITATGGTTVVGGAKPTVVSDTPVADPAATINSAMAQQSQAMAQFGQDMNAAAAQMAQGAGMMAGSLTAPAASPFVFPAGFAVQSPAAAPVAPKAAAAAPASAPAPVAAPAAPAAAAAPAPKPAASSAGGVVRSGAVHCVAIAAALSFAAFA